MPVIKPAVLSRSADLLRLFSVWSLFSPFSSRPRSSKRATMSTEQYPKGKPSSKRAGKPYLETQILDGANGDGRFMSSMGNTTGTQRSWLSRTMLGTWTGNRSHQNVPTTDATACTEIHHNNHHHIPDENIIMTTCVSSDSHGIQGEDLHKHDTLQTEKIRDMV